MTQDQRADEGIGDLVRTSAGTELPALDRPLEELDDRLPAWAHNLIRVRLCEGGIALQLTEEARQQAADQRVGEQARSMERRLPSRRQTTAAVVLAGAFLALAAGAGIAFVSSAAGSDSAVGQPPPEVAEAADSWPAHNYDLANSRATTSTEIAAANVATLRKKWGFTIPGAGAFGNFATTPIVLDGVVYFQDLNSNVYAVQQQTGKLKWKRTFKSRRSDRTA